ncbi:MAG: PAS domain S-box protein [Pedosphaera sp.]|nr:PAS domain S-box protein [Pedosphaera sp.]
MKTQLRVLIVEDSEFDSRILVSLLRAGGYEIISKRVETSEDLAAALTAQSWDLVLADYNLPRFSAPEALKLLQDRGVDLPFVIISGGIGEDIAVAAMKAGAHDYLMKGNLARLLPAVERELREAEVREARRQAEQSLRENEARYRLLWETASDAVLLMDTDSCIHFANPAVRLVFGYAPEELIEQNLTLLLPEKLHPSGAGGVMSTLHSGVRETSDKHRRVMETCGVRKDGAQVVIEIAFNDMEFQNKRWFVAFIRDITARKQAEEELRQTHEQFRVAREIQQRLFPKTAPQLPGFDIAGVSHPAEATGGDYFDYIPMLNGRLGIVVGDVTGHGVGPALLMAETRAYLRILARNRDDVGDILTRANRVLAEDVGSERFVTLFLAQIDAERRTLCYASAGHPPAYVLGEDGTLRAELKRTGIPLGIDLETVYDSPTTIELKTGDTLVFLTDGIEETLSPQNEFFGGKRVLEVLQRHRHLPATAMVDALHHAVREFAAGEPQLDDFTAIVMKIA